MLLIINGGGKLHFIPIDNEKAIIEMGYLYREKNNQYSQMMVTSDKVDEGDNLLTNCGYGVLIKLFFKTYVWAFQDLEAAVSACQKLRTKIIKSDSMIEPVCFDMTEKCKSFTIETQRTECPF